MSNTKNRIVRINLVEFRQEYIGEINGFLNRINPCSSLAVLGDAREKSRFLIKRVREIKISANRRGHEDIANEMLGKQCIVTALLNEVLMWMNLKEDKQAEAWDSLVTAEEHMALARRIPFSQKVCDGLNRDYAQYERMLFPRVVFQSAAFDHEAGKCTICDKLIFECGHVPGRIYCGQVCAEYGYPFVHGNHIAIVEDPKDRRCIIRRTRHVGEDWKNVLTGSSEKYEGEEKDEDPNHLMSEGIFMTFTTPPGVFL